MVADRSGYFLDILHIVDLFQALDDDSHVLTIVNTELDTALKNPIIGGEGDFAYVHSEFIGYDL